MYHVIYVSSASRLMDVEELGALLSKSRDYNSRHGITGVLLYRDGNFLQILEGDESAVRAIFSRISCDPRHRGLITLSEGPSERREFPEWWMGFREMKLSEVELLPGFTGYMNVPRVAGAIPTQSPGYRRLLELFRSGA